MRVVYLTAGAAGMYCGSCMRDNTLVAALRRGGRDVLLVPLYTPILTDEADVSEPFVLYGAINVYLDQTLSPFRRLPRMMTQWLDSPPLLRRVARLSGKESPRLLGELTVSTLQGRDGRQARELRTMVDRLRELRPSLVNLPNAMFVHLADPIHQALGVPVVCTLTGEDIFLDALEEPWRSRSLQLIRDHARNVDAFAATSEYYAEHCQKWLGLPAERLHVIPPGIAVEQGEPPAAPRDEPFRVGYLARICPVKGLHVLAKAVEILREAGRSLQLVVAGQLNPADRPYLDALRSSTPVRFDYLGQPDRTAKLAMLRSLHLLSVPTLYREPKGLYVFEALSQAVPVVQPNHGAFPEWIKATEGGLLTEPDNPSALAEAIAALMDDPARREQLGRQGRAAVIQSFTDRVMADRTWALYDHLCEQGHA